jgi:hypothetical protein
MKQILITVDGGIIQDIKGIPPGYELVTRDYDVEGMDLETELARGTLYIHPTDGFCAQTFVEAQEPWDGDGTRRATAQDVAAELEDGR